MKPRDGLNENGLSLEMVVFNEIPNQLPSLFLIHLAV